MPRREAMVEASRLRLRPILTTSFAFIFGVLPLALAEGTGRRRDAAFAGDRGVQRPTGRQTLRDLSHGGPA
jgi:hypothetical protein